MRMRTSVFLLVQIIGLIFPATALAAAAHHDYGSGADTAPESSRRPAQPGTQAKSRATAPAIPDASTAHQGPAQRAPTVRPDTPPRGMTKPRVLARYGNPVHKNAPVGQPPITRWDYPDYRLYFEYDHVLHAVVPDQPAPIAHTEQLQTGQRHHDGR